MIIELPYNAKVSTETKAYSSRFETVIEIEDNNSDCANAFLEAYNRGDFRANTETINEFFERNEDDLQDWLTSRGYIFNKA